MTDKKGPRITPADIEANIEHEYFFTGADGVIGEFHRSGFGIIEQSARELDAILGPVTICILLLRNGTKIVGVNYGAIDPAQHDAKMGRDEARAHAIEQVWPLMGYELRERLARG